MPIVLILLSVFFISIYCFIIEPKRLKITRYSIKDNQLNGLKIVFISDLHLRINHKKRLEKLIDTINKQNADIVLSAGDYIFLHHINKTLPIAIIAQNLSKIKSKYGFYTVLGNHDGKGFQSEIINEFQKYNIPILKNTNIKIEDSERTIYIAGLEDLQTGKPNIFKALKNTNAPIILLMHNPDIFQFVPEQVNITLAGHTHGGQIRLPFIGAVIIPSKYKNKYGYGLINEGDKKMIVTNGIGNSVLDVRFNCIPEIVVIDFE